MTILRDWRIRARGKAGLFAAIALFVAFYVFYNFAHPKGFSSQVFVQNANEMFALGMLAMAQTVPVLLGGLDLSVGAVMTLVDCLASHLLEGSPIQIAAGIGLCLAAGAGMGFLNGVVVVYGRIQPIIATLATSAIAIGLALFLRPKPGGKVNEDLSWALTNSLGDFAETLDILDGGKAGWFRPFAPIPVAFVLMALVALLVWLPFSRTIIGRTVYSVGSAEGAAYMSGLPVTRAKLAAFTLSGLFAAFGGLFLAIQTSSGNADIPQAGSYTPELDRSRGDRRNFPAGRVGGRDRLAARGHDPSHHLLQFPHLRHRAAAAAARRRGRPADRRQPRRAAGLAREEPAGAVSMSEVALPPSPASRGRISDQTRPILIASGFIGVILVAGTAYTLATQGAAPLLFPPYLLQQLQTGSFLGVVAAGMMLVILLGQIDLSVAWTLTAAAMMATAAGGEWGSAWAVPTGLGVGLAVGLVNGVGVAYLRVPSMIFTLGVNAVLRGLMVAHTGGFAPQTAASDLMRFLGAERIGGFPVAIALWASVSVLVSLTLTRTSFGRSLYAVGTRERAAYLAGMRTQRVTVGAFVLCSLCASLAGVMLAGYATKAYQGMGDAYVLPSIAAVVVGGTNILGGRGRLPRHVGRRHAHRALELRALDHADARGWSTNHLRRRHHRHAAHLRARAAGDQLTRATGGRTNARAVLARQGSSDHFGADDERPSFTGWRPIASEPSGARPLAPSDRAGTSPPA